MSRGLEILFRSLAASLFLFGSGCARFHKVYLRHDGLAPIVQPTLSAYRNICGSSDDDRHYIAGCVPNEGCDTIYVHPRTVPGSIEFMRIVEHEQVHIELGCKDDDHCYMRDSLVNGGDYCDSWKEILKVRGEVEAK